MKTSERIKQLVNDTASSAVSLLKVAMNPHRSSLEPQGNPTDQIIIMGNGPSLRETITHHLDKLQRTPTMAVNFAANAADFFVIKPSYYLLFDPHFFNNQDDVNVAKLYENLGKVNWPMTLIVPAGKKSNITHSSTVTIKTIPTTGAKGFKWLIAGLTDAKMAMPRPRNVMIPAIISAIWLGYKEIYLTGADHTWTKTLSVNSENEVVSIQPHFYKEDEKEQERVTAVYKNVRIDQILESFSIAFKSYHTVAAYATHRGVKIFNSTPGSFIDAFKRKPLP